MGMTYTSRRDRDRRHARTDGIHAPELALLAVTVVSLLAISLCYAGRMRAFDAGEAQRPEQTTVDLGNVTRAAELERSLAPVFAHDADRRFAAAALLSAVRRPDLQVRLPPTDLQVRLPNVGAIARIDVPAASIDSSRSLVEYRERLREARARAVAATRPAPTSIPLFTSSDLTAIKPGFVVRDRQTHARTVFWCAAVFLIAFPLVSLVWRVRGIAGDRVLLAAAHVLATLGFVVMLSRPDPLRDTLLLVRYTQSVTIALGVCLAVSFLRVRTAAVLRLSYLSLAAAVLLSLLLVVFGTGPGASGAKVNLGPIQPIEAIRFLVALFLAGYLGRRWELVRQTRETAVRGRPVPSWLNLPRLDHLLPVLGGVGLSLLLFFALRDLGPALLVSLTFMAMLAVARARAGLVAVGLAVLAGGFTIGYWLGISRTLIARVGMWLSPWDNGVRGGDQVAQAAWAIAAGGWPGTGLGLGDTRYLPAGHTDLVLAAVGEELGIVGVLAATAAAALIGWRGLRIARRATSDTTVFLAVAMTLALVAPMLVMAAGILGLIPLTGVVTPFMSYGGSAMIANFAALGLLSAIGADRDRAFDTQPFRVPLQWLARGLATAAIVLVVIWGRVQIVAADDFLVRPQLGAQADGGRRYQYNPRVLDAARTLPRGTIVDRREVPVAAAPAVLREAERELTRLGVSARDACAGGQDRCYPFGGAMFHLLGDARTRLNWAAANSSYIERDEEDALRGFNDRAATVRAEDDEGQTLVALRRDYRDLIPLVRHRWQPDHPDVVAVTSRPRDLQITIDARLQLQVASILARSSASAGIARSAVVVLDAETGEVLASVSYPWPVGVRPQGQTPSSDALLDRARYGLYPPGSTFKLVTAAAALRQDAAMSRVAFTCSALPGGRVGAKIPGFGRPIRDDVLDRHPHGTLTMHDGLVQSCNAYFAQMAARLGTEALASTAALAGISYPTTGPADRLRENLPYAGYGQGLVLASPLRLARIAAAIGTDGQVREPSLVRTGPARDPKPFLSEASARTLASYMRDVVTSGTGRLLSNHPARIAGKTGTAEVDDEPSHAWFVGFAPAGPATRRIAFAVLLEHAGYGGGSAASVAGQVVSAAASLGMVR